MSSKKQEIMASNIPADFFNVSERRVITPGSLDLLRVITTSPDLESALLAIDQTLSKNGTKSPDKVYPLGPQGAEMGSSVRVELLIPQEPGLPYKTDGVSIFKPLGSSVLSISQRHQDPLASPALEERQIVGPSNITDDGYSITHRTRTFDPTEKWGPVMAISSEVKDPQIVLQQLQDISSRMLNTIDS